MSRFEGLHKLGNLLLEVFGLCDKSDAAKEGLGRKKKEPAELDVLKVTFEDVRRLIFRVAGEQGILESWPNHELCA